MSDTATTLPKTTEVKKPRLMMTKIVAGYLLLLLLLAMLFVVTSLISASSQLPLMRYVSMAIMIPLMILGGGFAMLKPWYLAAIVFQPVFPILFLIFRSSWLQFMGMMYHLVMAGFMMVVACECFYYYSHFDELEKNDNPGILEIFALFQGGMSISNAVVYIGFAVMLFFDVRKQKKYRLLSGEFGW